MARGIGAGRGVTLPPKLPKYKIPTVLVPEPRTYFKSFKGLDTQSPLSELDDEHAAACVNLIFNKKIIAARPALAKYGTTGTVRPQVNAFDLEINALRWPIRFDTATFWYILSNQTDWTDVGLDNPPAVPLLLSETGNEVVVWGESSGTPQMVFSEGPAPSSCTLLSWQPAGAVTALDLGNSPSAEHLAVFGNRVVASYCYGPPYTGISNVPTVYPNRVQWSAKDNDAVWNPATDISAGTEDVIVLTDDISDDVQGVYPVSDTTALLVRRGSIWRIDLTGYVNTPFQFSLLTDKLGTTGRRTIRRVPGGVVFLGYDDVYLVTLFEIKKIGLPALYSVFNNPTFSALGSAQSVQLSLVAKSWGYYDRYNKLYWLNIKLLGTYVYSFDDQAWTKVSFPFEPWSLGHSYMSINGGEYHGVVVTPDTWTSLSGSQTTRLMPGQSADVDQNGNPSTSSIEIRTGYVSNDPLRKVHIVEAQIEYESSGTQTLIFETSVDGGNSWQAWATSQTIETTEGPTVLSARAPFQAANAMFRVRSTILGGIRLYAIHVFRVRGAMIHP